MTRTAICLASLLSASAVVLAGCGYAGEPKPPALRRPLKVADLMAVERGTKIVVTFVLPQETTEGLPMTGSPDIELRIGAMPAPWDQAAWQSNSERVPVPVWQIEPPKRVPVARKLGKKAGAKGAVASSGARAASGVRTRQTKAISPVLAALPPKASLYRSIEIDASKYVGKATVVGVRVHGITGRDDGWAITSLEVLATLSVPRDLKAIDAANAVHLQWSADAPGFRIFRRVAAPNQTDAEWVRIGDSTQPAFDDKTFEYGKVWQYYVQAVRQAGDQQVISDASEVITFTPKDLFPPAVPAGLIVIPGTRTIELAWDPVTDADLAGYRVYRNGVKIADALMTSAYSDKDVVVGTKYSYQVSAVDQAGNESLKGAAVEITME